jgi:TetR/AcrR family transcriptional regulator, cholesterol catabolism regulator
MTIDPTTRQDNTSRQGTVNTRDRILDAAASVLSEQGYAATRLTDIAALAGLRAPAMYHYFASRDELVMEVLRVGQQRVLTHVSYCLTACASTDPVERVMAAVEAHLRIELELSDFATAVTRNLGHVPPSMRETLKVESDAYHSLWRDLLEEAAAPGCVSPGLDLPVARMMVVGALNWTPEWWRHGDASIAVVVSTAQTMVARALFGHLAHPVEELHDD